MAIYNANNPLLSSVTNNAKLESYMESSLDPVKNPSIWEDFFYQEDIPSVDPKTGKKWVKTFRVSKPQGPGGYTSFTEDMWKTQSQPGYLGLMIPSDEEYQISTSFKYASIGRSFADQMNDSSGLYDAIKAQEFGPHIREQQIEEVKSEIFKKGIKTYAGGVANEDAITSTNTLKWSEVSTLVDSISEYEVQVIDNRNRVADSFKNAVKSIIGANKGSAALAEANVIDFNAFETAQKAFEASDLRTFRWTTPRFIISGIDSDNYNSTNISINNLKITKPDMKSLFTKNANNNTSPMAVLVSKEGYNQLWDDTEFQELVKVSGYQNEQGLSGRFDRHIRSQKAVMVQGILIINMETDHIHGSIASAGIDYGKSLNGSGIRLDAALVATPGYNFITQASEFGKRVTSKTFDDIDAIDRMGFHEFMYMLFTWDVQILTPSSFNLLIHASK